MAKTYKNRKGGKKERKGPEESATKFNIGYKKHGNDGNMWVIVATSSGTHRWKKLQTSTKKKSTKISNKNSMQKKTLKGSNEVSSNFLKQLKKKYNVTINGSKKNIANGLWRIRGHAMSDKDLEKISYLLSTKDQKTIVKQIKKNIDNPITNYKGMWKPLPKPLSKMSRDELIRNLRLFRDSWEKITTRNQDLDNERLSSESTEQLRKLLKFYYSNEAKNIAIQWLR